MNFIQKAHAANPINNQKEKNNNEYNGLHVAAASLICLNK